MLWPHPPPGGRHCQAVRGRVHRLDDGPGLPQGLHASARGQGTQHVHPDHPQAPLQRLCTKVGSSWGPSCAFSLCSFDKSRIQSIFLESPPQTDFHSVAKTHLELCATNDNILFIKLSSDKFSGKTTEMASTHFDFFVSTHPVLK